MKKFLTLLILIIFFTTFNNIYSAYITETTTDDFSQGELSNVEIINEGDGALRLINNPTITVLQIYPNGHSTTVVRDAIFAYQAAGNPPLTFEIYLLTISAFNTATSIDDVFTVVNAQTGQQVQMAIRDFDILYFGVADCYAGWDLSSSSAQVVRQFAQLGKGLVFTHDTIVNWSNCHNHVNFISLSDVTGLTASPQGWSLFTRVKLINQSNDTVLHIPFELPNFFSTLTTHWLGQNVQNGTVWYVGTDQSGNANYNLYMHTYHNPQYNSYSSFFSYGHTEAVPAEWEAKAMINCMYKSYQGGQGQGYYISRVYEFPSWTHFQTASWNAYTPNNSSVVVQARVAPYQNQFSNWVTLTNNQNTNLSGKYFQYKVYMTSTNNNQDLPKFYDFTIYYEPAAVPSLNLFGVIILLLSLSFMLLFKIK